MSKDSKSSAENGDARRDTRGVANHSDGGHPDASAPNSRPNGNAEGPEQAGGGGDLARDSDRDVPRDNRGDSSKLGEKVHGLVEKGRETSADLVDTGAEKASRVAEQAKSGVKRASEVGRESVDAAREKLRKGASGAAQRVKAGASRAVEYVPERAHEIAESGLERGTDMTEAVQEAMREQMQRAGEDETTLGMGNPGHTRTGLDISEFPEDRQLAFYGALFAMSNIGDAIERKQIYAVFEVLESEGLSEEAKQTLRGHIVEPPDLEACLDDLTDADEALQFATMINLVEVARADDLVEDDEEEALQHAQSALGVSDEQREEIETFVEKMDRVRERGLDDHKAAETIRSAVSGLAGVGVPVAAISVSGSVAGLSAAGITSGLAALGLGLGMVPGIGAAVFIGTATYIGAKRFLGTKRRRQKQAVRAERERRAQRLVENLQETIEHLSRRVDELQASAETAEANREAIEKLTARIDKLKTVLRRRKSADDGDGT